MTFTPAEDTTVQSAHRRRAPAGSSMLRLGLLALVAIGIAGAAAELAFERHWGSPTQLIPWVTLTLLTIALLLVAISDSTGTRTVVRVLALVVLLAAAYGVFTHVSVNHGMGAMDPAWDSMSAPAQWWSALTKSVGNAPPLAPGMLAQSALLLLLATTVRRPAK